MECSKKQNLATCACTYPDCPRKGICCQYLKYHLAKDELPACCFSKTEEKTYDRSINNFIKDRE